MKAKAATVELTSASFLKLVSVETLEDQFHAQQGAYMAKNKLTSPVVKPHAIRKYAKACFKSLREQIKACNSQRDFRRLLKAYRALTKQSGVDFLNAA